MPTEWTKWVALFVGLLIGLVFLMSFLIKYPDTVNGEISVTANVAPVRLVANANGRMYLVQNNKKQLHINDVIAYIESGANYKDVLYLDSLLKNAMSDNISSVDLPEHLILGEIGSNYSSFVLACKQYGRIQNSDIYKTMRNNLEQQIVSDQKIISNVEKELALKEEIVKHSKDQLDKDSILLTMKGVSEHEYREKYKSFLSLQESFLSLQSNLLIKQSEINRNKLEIQRIILEETENKEKAYSELVTNKTQLNNAINSWKEKYLLYTPISGELEYLGFWRENSFVQAGNELFSIIPEKNTVIGEVIIPSYGSGKVEIGQKANVKISNYPYDEYGLIEGVVHSISRITNKIKTSEGTNEVYLVIISFPNGTKTNFGMELPLDFETKGTVEIITKPKRLIARLFDNLKSKTVK
ncbi:HlyD family efflux transporter periplasmic adaptor subunit [Paludibacter sp. 221]|nr:HlyD family efflux transporter periplasmic adaptor subunit [Paludibacter sp. 221]